MQLLDFCLSATYFAYSGSVCLQTFGTATGSPVSVMVANVVMESSVEERALQSFNAPVRFLEAVCDLECSQQLTILSDNCVVDGGTYY